MKVTVCFDNTKIIVPCGDGELTISELIKRAVNRYCKASFIDNTQDIKVQCLQTEEQGILDIDDLVTDVCDDKDKLIAVYDDRNKKISESHPSDVDNNNIRNAQTAPFTAHHNTIVQHDDDITPYITSTLSDNDSGVAADSYGISSNPTSTHTSFNSSSRPPRNIQRRFAQHKNASFRSSASSNSPNSSPESSRKIQKGGGGGGLAVGGGPFSRDLNRKSLSTNHPMLYSWIDQHDRFNSPRFFQQNQSHEEADEEEEDDGEDEQSQHSSENEVVQLDRRASKTIDVQPYIANNGKEIGLVVYNVEEGSYVDRVGELQTADRITEINGIDVTPLTNNEAMNMYNAALKDDVIKIKRARSHSFLKDSLNQRKRASDIVAHDVPDRVIKASKEAPRPVPTINENETPREVAIEAPTAKDIIEPSDSKRHVFTVDLLKDKDGLGFTVTSKDVLTSKECTFFIKNILGKGAAIKDGRLKAGDQLLAINDAEIKTQGQTDVVKILRSAQGIVTLKLSRAKAEMTGDEIASLQNKPAAISREMSEVVHSTTLSPPPSEEILKLTIPLSSAGTESLGITVKGKRTGGSESDDGIYVNSVMKGGSAAKDGRLFTNDHLMCINDTSLIGLSNRDAMSVLRGLLEQSKQKGTIRIIIGRQANRLQLTSTTSSPVPPASPVRGAERAASRESPVVNRKQFQRPPSPSLDRGRKTPERYSPRLEMRRKVSVEKKREPPREQKESSEETDKEFDDRYLQRGLTPAHYAIGRNKSYFRAVSTMEDTEDSDVTLTYDDAVSRRTVSISSTEIPSVQRPLFIEQEPEIRNSKRGKKPLPSYEEALKRRNSSSSTHSSNKADSRNNSFKVLPDKYFAISKEPKPAAEKTFSLESNVPEKYILPKGDELFRQISKQKSLSLDSINKSPDGDLPEHGIHRCNTLASQSSLDSVLASSYQFSRDGFGRLSISEKKGRGQIDATQSQLYNKLKKYKSMEELRPSSSHELLFADDTNILKRSESIDTIISKIDAEEQQQAFKRNDIYSASTPWGMPSPILNGGDAIQQRHHEEKPVPRRIKPHLRSRRPYSCILEDARQRHSLLLNDSFKSALDHGDFQPLSPTSSNVGDDKKKKTGLFNTLSGLLKKNKKAKDGKPLSSPEQLESPPRYNIDNNDVVRRNKNTITNNSQQPRPQSLGPKFLQADRLQQELVQAKIEEMKKAKSGAGGIKKRKSDNEIHKIGRASPVKDDYHRGAAYKSGYNTWNVHDATNMREKSKQFFMNSNTATNETSHHDNKEISRKHQQQQQQSRNAANLQRQSSLPPRAKKDSVEIHRVLPRAPSGPMYRSPEQKHRTAKLPDTPHHVRSSSTPNSKATTPVKPGAVRQTNSGRTPNNRLKKPSEDGSEIRYTSISDLTRPGGSVKISHKAEI